MAKAERRLHHIELWEQKMKSGTIIAYAIGIVVFLAVFFLSRKLFGV